MSSMSWLISCGLAGGFVPCTQTFFDKAGRDILTDAVRIANAQNTTLSLKSIIVLSIVLINHGLVPCSSNQS